MPHTLLLRLPAAAHDDAEWLSIDATGLPADGRQRGPLNLAAAVSGSSRVVVIVPATHLLLTEAELPPGSGMKLARAVPFALEEQLTEDIDKLHFALGKRRASGGTPVAVVSREALRNWLEELAAAGIEPQALYADMALLPQNPGQTVLWLEGHRLSVRRPGQLPFAVELTPVTDALIVAGLIVDPLAAEQPLKSLESAILYVARDDWAAVQDEIEGLMDQFASLKIQLLSDGPLPWLARELASTDAVNLLQGEFLKTGDYGANWRRWRTAAALGVALLVVHVAAQAIQWNQAKRETVALNREIATVFATAMPGQPLQEPRQQMQSRLERIRRAGAGPEQFLRTLQAVSGALAGVPNTNIQALSYHENGMDIKMTAPSLASLAQFSQVLTKQGLSADIRSSTPQATGIEAQVQVRSGGAKALR